MHHFEEGVVAIADDSVVELADRGSPQIFVQFFQLPFGDLLKNVSEEFPELLGTDTCFACVLCQVLENWSQAQ